MEISAVFCINDTKVNRKFFLLTFVFILQYYLLTREEVTVTLYEKIKAEHRKLENQIKSLNSKIEKLPSGKITYKKDGKYYKWYYIEGKNRNYISSKNKKLFEKKPLFRKSVSEYYKPLSDELAEWLNEAYETNVKHLSGLVNRKSIIFHIDMNVNCNWVI